MRNPDILLWFIRKKHRNQKYDLFLCCSLRHFGGSHSLPQNPLNGNLAHIQTDRHIHKLCTKNTCAKLWGGQAWHRVPALCVFICRIKVTNQSDGRQKKKKNGETNHFHTRQAAAFPSERGRLRCSTFSALPTTQQLCPDLL